ncbi:hypothetical protein [Candidatus Poriferisodalis sp.]|uniref:hypothetical protein n=1 Tax=Candidatus Poriferisodalis sp. TaxID=3101277 RepID=UPI003AF7504C
MPRRIVAALEDDALAALIETLARLGVVAKVLSRVSWGDDRSVDAVVEIAGQRFDVEVKSMITAEHGQRLAGGVRRRAPVLVIADRIAAEAKRTLREAGVNYLDRRGEMRIMAPPLIVDTVVESTLPEKGGFGKSLDSQVAKEVAICCLLTPDEPHGVRQTARLIDRAPSAVSSAMTGLRDDGLLTAAGEPLIPDLFHELTTVWKRRAIALAALPPTRAQASQRLELGLDEPEHTLGWALTDSRAAASWGMPILARGDHPPDFYVQSDSVLRAARLLLGDADDPAVRACTVAVAPVRLVCLRRLDHSQTSKERWPVANHIVVALDIAQDKARGLEALQQWEPERIVRAW